MMAHLKEGIQYVDLLVTDLIQKSIERQEGILSADGVLTVTTGNRTGRSPKVRFLVQDDSTINTVNWGDINQPIELQIFTKLWDKTQHYLEHKDVFISHLQVGADNNYGLAVKVINEYAWHNAFCQHLFIKRDKDLKGKEWTLMSAPGLVLNPAEDGIDSDCAVILNLNEKKVLLCGMRYAGEMKKAMFTALNYFLPTENVLPMHCAANQGESGDVCLFFGLSGTGKTTLSADPDRYLIGDDEHGWSSTGVFNFEGGCYAKCINLSLENEPLIFNAIRDHAIMENVVLTKDHHPDFKDTSITQNTRVAYPRSYITKRVASNTGNTPQAVVFLTCDMYGVLPPVALLNKEQAAYYFLSGYTALVGSTEVGSAAGIQPTFSTCFGAPFFPRKPIEYAQLLIKRLEETPVQVFLINTGWTGGQYGENGERFAIPQTRAIVSAAVNNVLTIDNSEIYPGFNFLIPKQIAGFSNQKALNPKNVWQNTLEWQLTCNKLIEMFNDNFKRYHVSNDILNAAPIIIE